MHKDGNAVARAINGQDGKAWHLPLPPLSATSLPEVFSPGEAPESDRARAAFRLVSNHAAVARFAARGAGQPGARPVSAPLSDPSAEPNEGVVEHVDAALQCVARSLLHGPESCVDASAAFKVRFWRQICGYHVMDSCSWPCHMPSIPSQCVSRHTRRCVNRVLT